MFVLQAIMIKKQLRETPRKRMFFLKEGDNYISLQYAILKVVLTKFSSSRYLRKTWELSAIKKNVGKSDLAPKLSQNGYQFITDM